MDCNDRNAGFGFSIGIAPIPGYAVVRQVPPVQRFRQAVQYRSLVQANDPGQEPALSESHSRRAAHKRARVTCEETGTLPSGSRFHDLASHWRVGSMPRQPEKALGQAVVQNSVRVRVPRKNILVPLRIPCCEEI